MQHCGSQILQILRDRLESELGRGEILVVELMSVGFGGLQDFLGISWFTKQVTAKWSLKQLKLWRFKIRLSEFEKRSSLSATGFKNRFNTQMKIVKVKGLKNDCGSLATVRLECSRYCFIFSFSRGSPIERLGNHLPSTIIYHKQMESTDKVQTNFSKVSSSGKLNRYKHNAYSGLQITSKAEVFPPSVYGRIFGWK